MKHISTLILFASLTFFSSSLYSRNQPQNSSWTEGQQRFTTSFYPFAKQGSKNLIFSPLSLQLGLAMASEIAYGDTQREILQISALPKDETVRRKGAMRFLNRINTAPPFCFLYEAGRKIWIF